jgi:predicted alpha/beta-hydrolase family hydrolase
MLTELDIPVGPDVLHGNLDIPREASGVVIFAHGSGSSRLSPRNTHVAHKLREHGLGTLLATSVRARVQPRRWSPRRKVRKLSPPSSHAADAPISRVHRSAGCTRRRS